jgi:hypothetical protein
MFMRANTVFICMQKIACWTAGRHVYVYVNINYLILRKITLIQHVGESEHPVNQGNPEISLQKPLFDVAIKKPG